MSVQSKSDSGHNLQTTTVRTPVSLGEVPIRAKRSPRQSSRLLNYLLKTAQRFKSGASASSKRA